MVIITLTAFVAVLASTLAFSINDFRFFQEFQRGEMLSTGRLVAENCKSPLQFLDNDEATLLLQSMEVNADIRNAVIYDNKGYVFARYTRKGAEPYVFPRTIELEDGLAQAEGHMLARFPIAVGEEELGALWLRSPVKGFAARLGDYLGLTALSLGVALGLALLFSLQLQKSITTPLNQLVGSMKDVESEGNYDVRIEADRSDELGVLGKQFNVMLAEISDRENELREVNNHLEELVGARTRELAHKRDELSKINAELEEYFYVFSHDLKSPLRAISSLSAFIEEDLGDALSGSAKSNMALLRSRCNHFEYLLNGLLEYSSATHNPLEPEQVDVEEFIRRLFANIDPEGRYRLRFRGRMPMLRTDRASFHKIMHHLLDNAVRFMNREGGTVTVSYTKIDGEHEFAVADEGSGIPAQYHEKVFQIFQTLEGDHPQQGLGIGLAIVRKIILRMNGRIVLEDTPAGGLCVRFSLPLTLPV